MDRAPTFHLRLTLTGLCLFARDTRDAANPAMDVLLIDPSRFTPSMPGMDPHRAVLYYDLANTAANATRPTGRAGSVDLTGDVDFRSLDSTGAGAPTVGALPPAVADLGALTGDRVDARWLTVPCGGALSGRVFLGAGFVSDFDASGPWAVNGQECYIAWRVSWLKPVFGANTVTLPGGAGPVLHPTADGMINLAIKNVVEEEQHFEDLPYQLPYVGAQRHFMAYSQMLKHRTPVGTPTAVFPIPGTRGSLITCGVAGGAVG